MAEHVITRAEPTHRRWDATLAPVLEVEPGDVVVVETDDFAGGQIVRDSTAADLLRLDFDAIYPLAGPIAVRGARPGDALAVEVLGFELPDWGWACVIPGLGLLAREEFPEPELRIFDLTTGDRTALTAGVSIPIEPFCGTMGVPGAAMRDVPIPPPHAGGGNMDCRHLTAGTRSTCRSMSRAGSCRSATRTRRRATARWRSRGWSARCEPASAWMSFGTHGSRRRNFAARRGR